MTICLISIFVVRPKIVTISSFKILDDFTVFFGRKTNQPICCISIVALGTCCKCTENNRWSIRMYHWHIDSFRKLQSTVFSFSRRYSTLIGFQIHICNSIYVFRWQLYNVCDASIYNCTPNLFKVSIEEKWWNKFACCTHPYCVCVCA